MSDIQKNLKNTKLIIIEVDGCLTNGLVYIDSKGNKIRGYNILDYTAINDIILKGYKVGFISSHNINYLKKPFKKIKLDFLAGKVHHKLEWVKNYIADKYIALNQVVFIGFGLSDIKLLKECVISVCPMNAHYKVNEICKIVSEFNGGDGVIRELQFRRANLLVSVLSERRSLEPYGLFGGANGSRGQNLLKRSSQHISSGPFATSSLINLGGKASLLINKGDTLLVLSPAGGGYGSLTDKIEDVEEKNEFNPRATGSLHSMQETQRDF